MKKTLIILALVFCTLTMSGCMLCHGHDGSNGPAMQRYWD